MSDIPKIGCVNHDCDRCKAADELRRLDAENDAMRQRVAELEQRVPDGWKLVPVNPDGNMKIAGGFACTRGQDIAHHTYTAMLAAAPQPQPVQKPVAWALQFGDDVRICLSTVFDTRDEAQDYASSCIDKTELTPLYTSPQATQPLSDEHLSKLLCALHSETNAKINLHEWLRASPALAVRIAQAEDEWVKAVMHLVQVQMAAQEYVTTHGITKGTT